MAKFGFVGTVTLDLPRAASKAAHDFNAEYEGLKRAGPAGQLLGNQGGGLLIGRYEPLPNSNPETAAKNAKALRYNATTFSSAARELAARAQRDHLNPAKEDPTVLGEVQGPARGVRGRGACRMQGGALGLHTGQGGT